MDRYNPNFLAVHDPLPHVTASCRLLLLLKYAPNAASVV